MKPYYEDDWVTLFHGDCLELADVWTCADVLVTDPPYGIDWAQPDLPAKAGSRRGQHGSMHAHNGIANDSDTAARDSVLRLFGDKPAVVFSAWSKLPLSGVKQVLTWQKPGTVGVIGAKYGYRRDTEAICLIGKHSLRSVARSSVLVTKGSNTDYQNGSHPHMKPVPLLEQLIEWTSGVVADPFAGSGSTLIAARNLGRKVIGVELEEKYCEVIAKRLDATPLPMFTPEPTAPATVAGAFDFEGLA